MSSTTVTTPITGEVIAEVEHTSTDDLDELHTRARAAQSEWASWTPSARAAALRTVADRMDNCADGIAGLETLNTGKPLVDTRREAVRAAGSFRYYAGWADKVAGTTLPVRADMHTYTLREPRGVVAGIVPWNVPYFFAAKKLAPALAFGNACLLKPAAETPMTSLRLQEILEDAGLPEGLATVVPGGAHTGAALVDDPRTDLIVFTGSHETGRRVAERAALQLTPTVMELGGKSPQLVFSDADLDAALDGVMLGIFGACGQMCVAGSRLFVQSDVAAGFVERLAARVRALRVGDPRQPGVQVGPLITATQRDKVLQHLDRARDEGARVVAQAAMPTDPDVENGYFAPPTVFDNVHADMSVMREEIFGPVLAVDTFDDEDEALQKAHATDFGLAAGVWTSDIGRAHRMARDLDVGTVWINTYRVLDDRVPFGGNGQSGYGRENGEEALHTYSRVKSVWTTLTPGPPGGYRL